MLFRDVKHLFTMVSFHLMFSSVLLFLIFFNLFFDISSMDCMARCLGLLARINFHTHSCKVPN